RKRRGSASSRVAAGLRMAALSLRNSKTALGAHYRHMAARKGADVAVFALASPKAGHADLPPATLGAALPGRGSRRIRKTVPGRPFQTPGCQRQGPWLSTNAKGRHGLSLSRSSEESQIRRQNDCPTRNYTGSCDTEAITLITGFAGAGEAGGSVPVRFSGRGVSRVRARAAGLPAGLGSASEA